MLPSLSALRYRKVLSADGGPVARLEMADATILGERQFLANAYLAEGLGPKRDRCNLYCSAAGSGTAASPMIARYMAISEAMERWAHAELHNSERKHLYGFDCDPSSNGMAAFPGMVARQARRNALLEASERFNLLNWWEGRLAALEAETRWDGVTSATICSDAPGITVIVFRTTELGFVAYGHAAANDHEVACRKAAVEMERHAQVLRRFSLTHSGNIRNQLPKGAHPIERRSIFFALEEGHELFLSRLRSRPTKPQLEPRMIFDGCLPGPWAKYADVWRVVFAPPSERFLGNDENYFLW